MTPPQHDDTLSSVSSSGQMRMSTIPVKNDIEAIAGVLAGQYSCAYEGVNGVLYAGSKALYFVGTYFLFEKKIKLPWEIIRQVVKLDQGVRIWTKQDEVHTFSALHQPSRVWPVLVSLHSDALLDRPSGAVPTTSFVVPKRRNSDPASLIAPTPLVESEHDCLIDNETGPGQSIDPNRNVSSASNRPTVSGQRKAGVLSSSSSSLKRVIPVPGMSPQEVEDKFGEIEIQPIACTHNNIRGTLYAGWKGLYFYGQRFFWDTKKIYFPFTSLRQIQIVKSKQGICVTHKDAQAFLFEAMENPDKVWASLIALHNEILTKHQRPHHIGGGGSGAGGIRASKRGFYVRMNSDPNLSVLRLNITQDEEKTQQTTTEATAEPPRPMDKQWADCVSQKSQYPNLVVEKLILKCSLDEFFDKFLSNHAPHSIAKYLESRGDSALRASEWNVTTSAKDKLPPQVQPQNRVIHYKHPVNAPLAPPQAGARKEQTLTRYGKYGLCLETRTIVDDVPMADCFHVDDRIRVHTDHTDKDGHSSISVYMEFQITFIKSTMFKSIIEKTACSEFTDFFKHMGGYMSNALGEGPPTAIAPKPAAPPVQPDSLGIFRGGGNFFNPILTLLVILLQCYIIRDLSALKGSLYEVQRVQQQQLQQLLEQEEP